MSNFIQLNTKDESLIDVLGNGKQYIVPRYQRDYSWETTQLEDFWEEIDSMGDEDYHYMGYLVLEQKEKRKQIFSLIDGQQRLTTFSFMVLSAMKRLQEKDEKDIRIEEFHRTFIGKKDIVNLQFNNKLTLNRNNNLEYENAVQGKEIPKRNVKHSVRLMRQCFDFFYDRFKNKTDKEIASFIDKASQGFLFTSIYVSDELNAYKVFETLNSRGVQLTSGDLLKNYLFSLLDETNNISVDALNKIEDKWEKIGNNIGSKKYAEYILHEWNSCHKVVRKTDLYKNIRKEIQSKVQAQQYLDKLYDYSSLYAALQNGADEFWKDFPEYETIKRDLDTLQLFNIKQQVSLLFITFIKQKKNFSQVLRWISIFSFRYNVICGKHHEEQRKLYNQICLKINQGCKLEDIKEKLLTVYPKDDEFKKLFEYKNFSTNQSNKKPRYILARLIEEDKNNFRLTSKIKK